jgi:hypothetical protein
MEPTERGQPAEHRHVMDTIGDMRRKIDAARDLSLPR